MGNKQTVQEPPISLNFTIDDEAKDLVLSLPTHLWIKIMRSYLAIHDVIALSGTCSMFSNLVKKTPDFWTAVIGCSKLEQDILTKCFKFGWSMKQRRTNLRQWHLPQQFMRYTCKKVLLTSSRIFFDEIARRDNLITDVLNWLADATFSNPELCAELREWGFWELFNPQHPSRIQPLLWLATALYPVSYVPAASLLCNIMFEERTTDHLHLQMPSSVDLTGYIQKANRYSAEGRELVLDWVGIFTVELKDIYEKAKCSTRPSVYEVAMHVKITRQGADKLSFSGTGTDQFAGEFTFTGHFNILTHQIECEKVYTVGSTEWGGHPRSGNFMGKSDGRGIVGLWGAFRNTQFGAFRVWPKNQLELIDLNE